jgi:hypothetical protein
MSGLDSPGRELTTLELLRREKEVAELAAEIERLSAGVAALAVEARELYDDCGAPGAADIHDKANALLAQRQGQEAKDGD